MGATIMYARILKTKDFGSFYTLLIKSLTEKGYNDKTFDREMLNVEAKRTFVAVDQTVIGLFHNDEMCGFAILLFDKNTFNEDKFVNVDMAYIQPSLRDIDSMDVMFEMIYDIGKQNSCDAVFVTRNGICMDEREIKDFFSHGQFFQTDAIWKARL